MNLHELTTLQTLALTFPLIASCLIVLYKCTNVCFECVDTETPVSRRYCWMIYGIFFSFIGKIVESVWWFIPWTAKYISHPAWDELNSFGVYINLPFRQVFFSAAAYCYLRSFISPDRGGRLSATLNWIMLTTTIAGQLFVFGLWKAVNQ